MQKNIGIEVIDTQEVETGELLVTCEITDEFKEHFKKQQGLKRWSTRRFEKFMIEGVRQYIEQQKEDREY
tara:strand:- start:1227 stop:1436 length:210 start_codon:yes stop_codon:yes gene_type:complete